MKKLSIIALTFLTISIFSGDIYGKVKLKKWFQADTSLTKKELKAIKIDGDLKIDGNLDETYWKKAPAAKNFMTYSPSMGDTSEHKTHVKVLYNNKAIFFGAILYDDPEKIVRGLSKRDDRRVNADKFWVTLNPYNDGKNIFKFEVTSANVQSDIKISPRNRDRAWDAVWKSKVRITDSGWVVEMRIPYDAIRFPHKDHQKWSVNFWRRVRRERQVSSWNFVDRTKDNQGSQYGMLTNIRNIEAPLRLSLFPYVSGYVYPEKNNTDYTYSAGMDLKYGINESFTLDMILIPDFGQKESDKKVLNLSPYEVKYNEKRPFFTEGTELFNKAGLFYSRRVGGEPNKYQEVENSYDDGRIVKNPKEGTLINATKISGRNKKGLGLGLFNAMSKNTYAEVKDSSGNKKKILTQPFTNYNILVADKNFGQNSYVNLINTNYYEPTNGKYEDVAGTAFKISDPGNYFAIWGNAAHSMVKDSSSGSVTTGQLVDARVGKISGNFKFNYRFRMLTNDYTHNALGYLRRNNEMRNRLTFRYGQYEPSDVFLNWNTRLSFEYNNLYQPREFMDFNIVGSGHGTLKNHLSLGFWTKYRPVEMNDFFEPRVEGRYFKRPEFYYLNTWLSTDYRKPIALDLRGGFRKGYGGGYFYEIGPRFRLNHKVQFNYKFHYDYRSNERGYVTDSYPSSDTIIFGKRDKTTYTNSIEGAYVFNNKSWINLKLRHYWSQVNYKQYYTLQQNGELQENSNYNTNHDFNYNAFNIDLIYSWNFAPGSFLKVMWKNNILESRGVENNSFNGFFDNLKNTFQSDAMNNSISIKISYYLDYKYLFDKSS
jgi:hypothetical protein